jgi:hypothetical protein
MISKMDILKIIPPKILAMIPLMLITFINTNFQHKEGSFDSVIGQDICRVSTEVSRPLLTPVHKIVSSFFLFSLAR